MDTVVLSSEREAPRSSTSRWRWTKCWRRRTPRPARGGGCSPTIYTDPTGHFSWLKFFGGGGGGEGPPPRWLETIHTVLDFAGFVPGPVGVAADLLNSAIYLGEGRYSEAALNALASIPGAGDALKASKMTAKAAREAAEALAKNTVKHSDDIAKQATKHADNIPTPLTKQADNVPTPPIKQADNVPTPPVKQADNVPGDRHRMLGQTKAKMTLT